MEGINGTNWNICRGDLSEECCKFSSEESGLDLSAGSSSGSSADKSVHHLIDGEIAKKICECSGVKVRANDGLPNQICGNCLVLPQAAANFKNTCRNSNECLPAIIEKTKKATLDADEKDPTNSNEKPLQIILNKDSVKDLIEKAKRTKEIIHLLFSSCNENTVGGNTADKVMNSSTMEQHGENKTEVEKKNDDFNLQTDSEIDESAKLSYSAKDLIEAAKIAKQIIHVLLSPLNENTVEVMKSLTVDKYVANKAEEKKTDDFNLQIDTEIGKSARVSSENYTESTVVIVAVDRDGADCNKLSNNQNTTCPPEMQLEPREKDDGAKCELIVEEGQTKRCPEMPAVQREKDDNAKVAPLLVDDQINSAPEKLCNEAKHEPIERKDRIKIAAEAPAEESEENYGAKCEPIVEEDLIKRALKIPWVQIEKNSDTKVEPIMEKERMIGVKETSMKASSRPFSPHKWKTIGEAHLFLCDKCTRNRCSKIRSNEKSYVCGLCYKRFTDAGHLCAHMRQSSEEKPFHCMICDRRFSYRGAPTKDARSHAND